MTHTNTMQKAAGAINTNGPHTDTSRINFRTVGAVSKAIARNLGVTQ
jgi:hypothetical protein